MKKILNLLKALFGRKSDIHKEKRLKIISVINKIKEAVNSPLASAIVQAIPGRTDDAILEAIRKWLPSILKGLCLAENGFNSGVAVREAVSRLKSLEESNRVAYYKMLGGELYSSFTGLPIDSAITEIQTEYENS
jgi:hypothetical protein